MSSTRLEAVRSLKYGTRRMLPGDVFDATNRDARVLVALGRAQAAKAAMTPPPEPPADPAADALKAARTDYEAAIGRKPFHGWDVDMLRTKIAEAQADDDA